MKQLLLVACSAHKHRHLKKGRACEIYTGTLFRLSLVYAKEQGLSVKILSAKYGFIDPEQEIVTYNQKLEKTYDGPWPKGSGFYVGGALYFANAPERFKSLVPSANNVSSWTMGLRSLCAYKGPVALGERKMKIGGVTEYIYLRLLKSPITKEQLFRELCEKFGDNSKVTKTGRGMRTTIDGQLRQKRMGVERNCTLHRKGAFYWVTQGQPTKRKGMDFGL